MVRLTCPSHTTSKTFGLAMRGKYFNHRVPLKYKRFKVGLDPDEILAHYSREDIDKLDPRAEDRKYSDARTTLGKRFHILPNLNQSDRIANQLFQHELERQRAIIARIEKIRVIIDSNPGKDIELMMNRGLSTPLDCATHVHDLVVKRSVIAEIMPIKSESHVIKDVEKEDDENESIESVKKSDSFSVYWDMNRPLEDNCRIRFRHFLENDVGFVNTVYWRSCSFVLGMAARLAFKDDIKVMLHSWPKPNIKTGSFVYDIGLNLKDTWQPTEQELRSFTKILWDIKNSSLAFDRLDVSKDVARELFKSNPFKLSQIDSIGETNGKITIYRCGGLLDMSVGPMISNTDQIGRITLAAVHPFESNSDKYKGIFYRFQGISLPQQLPLSSFVYQNILLNRAKKLNKASL